MHWIVLLLLLMQQTTFADSTTEDVSTPRHSEPPYERPIYAVIYGDTRWDGTTRDLKVLSKDPITALHRNVRDALLNLHLTSSFSLLIHLGDAVYSGDDLLQWSFFRDEFINPLRRRGVAFRLVLGNHELEHYLFDLLPIGLDPLRTAATLGSIFADRPVEQSYTNQTIDFGFLTLVLVNSALPREDIERYLEALQRSNPKPKILLLHRPLLATSLKHATIIESLRFESLLPLFPKLASWNIRTVLAGHDHVFSLLQVPSWPPQIVAPSAGVPLETPRTTEQLREDLQSERRALGLPKSVQGIVYHGLAAYGYLLLKQESGKTLIIPYLSPDGKIFAPREDWSTEILR